MNLNNGRTYAKDRRLRLPIHYESSHWYKRKKAREQYCEDQNWECWYCGEDLREKPPSFITEQPFDKKVFPKMFLTHPIHLQHSHETGMTEGAVHARCNAVLWQYEGR